MTPGGDAFGRPDCLYGYATLWYTPETGQGPGTLSSWNSFEGKERDRWRERKPVQAWNSPIC